MNESEWAKAARQDAREAKKTLTEFLARKTDPDSAHYLRELLWHIRHRIGEDLSLGYWESPSVYSEDPDEEGEEAVDEMEDLCQRAAVVEIGSGIVTAENATADKGYPHPGSAIVLPDGGGTIHLQYGHPQEVGRNGCFTTDVIQGLIDSLSVYQRAGHPMASTETDLAIMHLESAKARIEDRKAEREGRGVHQTDKP